MKVALTVISKNRETQIVRMLESTKAVFDYYILVDTGSTDNTMQAWRDWCTVNKKEYKVEQNEYPTVEVNGKKVLGDFAMARNDSLRLAKETDADFIFWIDSDDELQNPEVIHTQAQRMRENGWWFMVAEYMYSEEIDGHKGVTQMRERLVDLQAKNLKWVGRVHEGLIADVDETQRTVVTQAFSVKHKRSNAEALDTGRRNKLIMEAEIKEFGIENVSQRLLEIYAFDAYEHKEYSTAIMAYVQWIKNNESVEKKNAEQMYMNYDKLARCYIATNTGEGLEKAADLAYKMLLIAPTVADGYLRSAEIMLAHNQPELAITYADKAIKLGVPPTASVVNHLEYVVMPLQIKASAYVSLGKLSLAKEALAEAVRLAPSEHRSRLMGQQVIVMENEQNITQAIYDLKEYIEGVNMPEKLVHLMNAIPEDLKTIDKIGRLVVEMSKDIKRKVLKDKLPEKMHIAFYAGQGFEKWNGNSIKEKGIGGSEEMMINMARELASLGNKVEVYNMCGEGGIFDGVEYIDFRKFDSDKEFDVLIISRMPEMFRAVFGAKRQYLWLHDTGYGDVLPKWFNVPNKVFALSRFHRGVLQKQYGIKDSQFYVTRNGVDLDLLPKGEFKRDNHKMFWGSSYDRGLLELLEMWSDIKKEVPDATLEVTYGWNTFDGMMAQSKSPSMAEYKDKVSKLLEQEGIAHHGRVPQDKQLEIIAGCGIWAYPTWFSETSCITAMKCQIMGCIPVCTPVAALKETVIAGIKVGDEQKAMAKDKGVYEIYKQALISLLKDDKRQAVIREQMTVKAKELYDFKKLAKEWHNYFQAN